MSDPMTGFSATKMGSRSTCHLWFLQLGPKVKGDIGYYHFINHQSQIKDSCLSLFKGLNPFACGDFLGLNILGGRTFHNPAQPSSGEGSGVAFKSSS